MYEPVEQLIIESATKEIERSKIPGARRLLPIGLPMAKLKNDPRLFHESEHTAHTLFNRAIMLFLAVYEMPEIKDVTDRFGEDAIRVQAQGDPVDREYVCLATDKYFYDYYQTNINMVLHVKKKLLSEICLTSSLISKLVVENSRNVDMVVEAYASLVEEDLVERLRNKV